MTDAETLEMVALFSANAHASFTFYISFTFGFLTVCYLVGNKLTKFQSVGLGILFSLVTLASIVAFKGNVDTYSLMWHEVPHYKSQLPLHSHFLWGIMVPIIMTISVGFSLYYLRQVRNTKAS